jgi:hypothetical protein
MSMMLYLHVSCFQGVMKLGETGDPYRGKGQSSSTFYPDVLSFSMEILDSLLGTPDPWVAEQRIKAYERLLLKYLRRFLLDDRREVPEHHDEKSSARRERCRL